MKIDKGVSLKQKPAAERAAEQDKQLREAAKMYEQHFMREMVKAMRQSVQESDLTQSSFGEKIWREQLDNQYVENWGERGGVGLSDMIYEHVKERYFPEAQKAPVPPTGPVEKSWKGLPIKSPEAGMLKNSQSSTWEFKAPPELKDRIIKAPWDGLVEEKFSAPNGLSVVKIRHDQGLVSKLTFPGTAGNFAVNSQVQSGQTLGEVQGPAPWLQWQLTRSGAPDQTS